MHTKRLFTVIIILLAAVPLTSCTSSFVVQVSAIADPAANTNNKRYVLVNGNTEGQEDDLFFREFSAYFIPILAEKGYQRVDSRKDADMEIFFRYAISEGRTGVNTFARPIYETIGGNTINITRTRTNEAGATTTTRSTVYVPLQTIYAGTILESRSYTVYTSSAALEAYKIKPAGKILWKTLMNITTDSNDLRTTIPIMAAAAAPYLAGNSGAAKKIRLTPDDPKISAIRKNAGVSIK